MCRSASRRETIVPKVILKNGSSFEVPPGQTVAQALTAGGIGTGGGLAGAIVALVLGLIAIALGGLALSRSRRTG